MGTHKGLEQQRVEAIKGGNAGRRAAMDDDDDKQRYNNTGEFDADRDMLDIDVKDEFQDDDEGMLFQGEDGEDGDDIERRIYLEMRDAGLGGTGVKEEVDVEEQLHKEQLEKIEEKKKQKRLRKQLRKREHQGQYSDDSDSDDPYKSSSESDSEEEREEERKKKEEEAKKAAAATAAVNGDKSGGSTRGTNTPTGRSEKRDPTRLGASLKRPGSPDASDLSGNESSRKKVKSINGKPIAAMSNGARASSPADALKVKRGAAGSGSGSDTDTSRPGRTKLKLKNSPPGSPSHATPTGSRAGSPAASGSRTPSFPTLDEVRAAIPPQGIAIKALVALFKSKVGTRSADFIGLVKQAGQQSKDPLKKGLIEPKP
jgi:transcription initiation factor TFIIF subunit alpha